MKACSRPAIVNYVSLDAGRHERFLPLPAKYRAEVVLLTADPLPPTELEETLKSGAIPVGTANEAVISNDRILVDPGVLHVTYSIGQRQSQALIDLIPAISGL